jgi:hypothetical protein
MHDQRVIIIRFFRKERLCPEGIHIGLEAQFRGTTGSDYSEYRERSVGR